MARRSRKNSGKSSWVRLRGRTASIVRLFAAGAAAIALCAGSFFAFNAGSDSAGSGISEIQLKRDLAHRTPDTADAPESGAVNAEEPARLTVDAMTEAAPLQVRDHSSGPLFDGHQVDSGQLDGQLTSSHPIPIERTRFRPVVAGRVRANQAAWLTGKIESVQ